MKGPQQLSGAEGPLAGSGISRSAEAIAAGGEKCCMLLSSGGRMLTADGQKAAPSWNGSRGTWGGYQEAPGQRRRLAFSAAFTPPPSCAS